VTGAERSGLLRALAEPRPAADLAARTGLDEARVAAICSALAAFDVVVPAGAGFTLAPPWEVLVRPGGFAEIAVVLAGAQVQARLYESLGEGGDYWTMPSEDRVAYARSVSPDPFSDGLVAAFRAMADQDPDSAALAAGGRYLELGCGVAGRILVNLRAFPALHAVGVELAEDLVAVARERADRLGLADRLTVRHEDACAFDEPESFDFGFWSQFFFPGPTRRAALAALFRSLRPGGIAWAPCAVDFDALAADPGGPEARLYALQRLLLLSWGVPERSAAELCAEFAEAGFTDITTSGGGGAGPVRVRAVRP
jgi:SAM-dependent methyltransferase